MNNEPYFETPFLDKFEDTREANPAFEAENPVQSFTYESPFLSEFEYEGGIMVSDPKAGEVANFLAELKDSEFEEAVYEVLNEAHDFVSDKITGESMRDSQYEQRVESMLREHFAPLAQSLETTIERLVNEIEKSDILNKSEVEMESFLAEYENPPDGLSPRFEMLHEEFFKKIKSVVKKVASVAKKAAPFLNPAGFVLGKLKGLARPFLEKILKLAVNKLPPPIQPIALKVGKMLLKSEVGEYEAERAIEGEQPTATEVSVIQNELDGYLASLTFGEQESVPQELFSFESFSGEGPSTMQSYELDIARDKFVNDLRELKDGESAAPAIQNFIPALMAVKPIVKLGISIIGRDKVINFIAAQVAKLIGRFVSGPQATVLSRAIVKTGFNIIGFETSQSYNYQQERQPDQECLAYEALAATVEETVERLATLPNETFTDQELFEMAVYDAFEKSASANFPDGMVLPGVRETSQGNEAWMMMPHGKMKHYKKYTKTFDIEITKNVADQVESFRGHSLTSFLRDRLGITLEKPVKARMHLYEAIKGTWLSKITKYEKNTYGLGSSSMLSWIQLHPLTKNAAGLLLREPNLGKDVSSQYLRTRHLIGIGQRFYYLEIPGSRLRIRPSVTTGTQFRPGRPRRGSYPSNISDLQVILNFVKEFIEINCYLSEAEAIMVSEKIQKGDYLGAAIVFKNSSGKLLKEKISTNFMHYTKIIHESYFNNELEKIEQEEVKEGFAATALKTVVLKLIELITESAYNAVVKYIKNRFTEFVKAQQDSADGVTIRLVWRNFPGMGTIKVILQALKGKVKLTDIASISIPRFTIPEIEFIPGKKFR